MANKADTVQTPHKASSSKLIGVETVLNDYFEPGQYTMQSIRNLAHKGGLPHVRVGRLILFRREDVEGYLAKRAIGNRR